MAQAKSGTHSRLDNIKSTSAQLAITLALTIYTSIHGQLKKEDFIHDSFITEFKQILLSLLTEDSAKTFLAYDPSASTQKKAASYIYTGKENYFDENNKLRLSNKGIAQLHNFLEELEIKDESDTHCMNEFVPQKTVAVSYRRVAAMSSGLTTLNNFILFSMLYPINGDEILFDQQIEFAQETVTEDAALIVAKMLLVSLFSSLLLKSYNSQRSYEILSQYRKTCLTSMQNLQSKQSIPQEAYNALNKEFNILMLKSATSAENNRQNMNKMLYPAALLSIAYLVVDFLSIAITAFIRLMTILPAAACLFMTRYWLRLEQCKTKLWAKKHRKSIYSAFHQQISAELAIYGLEPVNSEEMIDAGNVNIRRRVENDVDEFIKNQLKDKMKISRLAQGGYLIELPNKDVCKNTSKEKTLSELISYMRGLIPEKYKKHDEFFIKEFLWQIRTQYFHEDENIVNGERQEAYCQYTVEYFAKQEARGIQYLHQHIKISEAEEKEMTPAVSLDSLTSLENSHAEARPDAVTPKQNHCSNLTTTQDESSSSDIGQKRFLSNTWSYQYYSLSRGVLPWQTNEKVLNGHYAKMTKSEENSPIKLSTKEQVNERIRYDAGWNPLVWATRRDKDKTDEQKVKDDLSWTLSYANYAYSRHGVMPWQNDAKVLDAYYVKKKRNTQINMVRAEEGRHSFFNESSSKLFDKLLASAEPEDSTQKNKLAEEHKKNTAGLLAACFWSTFSTLSVAALYPVFLYLPSGLVESSVECSSSFFISGWARYKSLTSRAQARQEAKLAMDVKQQS